LILDILQKFKVKGSKVKVTASRNAALTSYIFNNSDGDCSISLELRTDFDHVTLDVLQMFKINGSKHQQYEQID